MISIYSNIKNVSEFLRSKLKIHGIDFLLLMIAGDFIFFILHIYKFDPTKYDIYSINQDRGLGEIFQYLKYIWSIIILLILSLKSKKNIYLAWIPAFIILFIDDFNTIHESFGTSIAKSIGNGNTLIHVGSLFNTDLALRWQDVGELIVYLITITFIASILIFPWIRSQKYEKEQFKLISFGFLCLGFFGIIVDILIILPQNIGFFLYVMAFIEDAGEMLATSFIVFLLYRFNLLSREKL